MKYLAGVDEKDICLTLSSGALKGGGSLRCSCMFFVVCEHVRGEKQKINTDKYTDRKTEIRQDNVRQYLRV